MLRNHVKIQAMKILFFYFRRFKNPFVNEGQGGGTLKRYTLLLMTTE